MAERADAVGEYLAAVDQVFDEATYWTEVAQGDPVTRAYEDREAAVPRDSLTVARAAMEASCVDCPLRGGGLGPGDISGAIEPSTVRSRSAATRLAKQASGPGHLARKPSPAEHSVRSTAGESSAQDHKTTHSAQHKPLMNKVI